MSLPEACSVWIEQRVQEELDAKRETGASLREIGRTVAKEVERHFETKVNPDTIRKKAERMHGTNVPPINNNEISSISSDFEKTLKKSAKTENRGGARKDSGRKPKNVEPETASPPTEEPEKKPKDKSKIPYAMRTGEDTTEAWQFKTIAISHLKRIRKDDPMRVAALKDVVKWIEKTIKEIENV
jgi:hypothetical protein